jgi:hypothetical protein
MFYLVKYPKKFEIVELKPTHTHSFYRECILDIILDSVDSAETYSELFDKHVEKLV